MEFEGQVSLEKRTGELNTAYPKTARTRGSVESVPDGANAQRKDVRERQD